MTTPLRIVVLAALTVFVVPSFPTGSVAARVIHCENSKDCPSSKHCSFKHHHKTGVCVGEHTSAKKKY